MHGHPFSGPSQLWWGAHENDARRRNLFRSVGQQPVAGEMFTAGGEDGLIDSSGRIRDNDRASLHRLMASLSGRIKAETDPVPDNPAIPSGYTYLLQFIAHDIIDSIVTYDIDGDTLTPRADNARLGNLRLDTLYGAGPEECPHAYQFKVPARRLIPRTHLRVGPFKIGVLPDPFCPRRDIARSETDSNDLGFQDRVRDRETGQREKLREGLVADSRNDSHALISQLTIVFQLLHNDIVDIIAQHTRPPPGADMPSRELAFRQFTCARYIVNLIYRNIVFQDVLPKILDPRIYRRYTEDPHLPFDEGTGVPLEFSFGAFRFGHAMVRSSYNINSENVDERTNVALGSNGERVEQRWFVDWARFFEIDGRPALNYSRPIGPFHGELGSETSFLAKTQGFDRGGLPHRDLMSACSAGLLSVSTLCRDMRARDFDEVLPFEAWREPMHAWLTAKTSIEADQLGKILADPPLPFFVLFEAWKVNDGRCLGPLGSVIVAETLFQARKRDPLPFENLQGFLGSPIRQYGEALFPGDRDLAGALAEVPEIASMPDLLSYLKNRNLFATG